MIYLGSQGCIDLHTSMTFFTDPLPDLRSLQRSEIFWEFTKGHSRPAETLRSGPLTHPGQLHGISGQVKPQLQPQGSLRSHPGLDDFVSFLARLRRQTTQLKAMLTKMEMAASTHIKRAGFFQSVVTDSSSSPKSRRLISSKQQNVKTYVLLSPCTVLLTIGGLPHA